MSLILFTINHSIFSLQTIELLEELVEEGSQSMDVRDKDAVILRMRSAVASKQFGQEDRLCSLIADVKYSVISWYLKAPHLTLLNKQLFFFFLSTGLHTSLPQKPE